MSDTKGFYQIIAWLLPKKLVYYCLIRGWVNATTNKYSDTYSMEITTDEMIKRWDK